MYDVRHHISLTNMRIFEAGVQPTYFTYLNSDWLGVKIVD